MMVPLFDDFGDVVEASLGLGELAEAVGEIIGVSASTEVVKRPPVAPADGESVEDGLEIIRGMFSVKVDDTHETEGSLGSLE